MKKTKYLMVVAALLLSACAGENKQEQSNTQSSSAEAALVTETSESVEVTDLFQKQEEIETAINDTFHADAYSVDDPLVVVDPYEVSPLSAILCFTTDEDTDVEITIKGKDSYSDITHQFNDNSREHVIPVYGLYAGYENKVVLRLGDGTVSEITIKTDELPENVSQAEVLVAKDKANFEGFTFTSPTSGAGHYVSAYDVNGEVRWYSPCEFVGGYEITRRDNGHFVMADGRIAVEPYYGTGLIEINPLGKVYRQYSIPGAFHHDFKFLDNGNILMCSQITSTGCVEDAVVEINADTGELVRSIDLKNILPYKEMHSLNASEKDWFHNNSVDYDKDTNTILLSGRHIDGVVALDYDSEELKWILGSPEGWGQEWEKYFFTPVGADFEWQWAQHSARFADSNDILLFDNGNNKSKSAESAVGLNDTYSRGVLYEINTNDMTIEQKWEYGKELGPSFYSMYISEVEYWGDNHYIVHSGGIALNEDGSPAKSPFAPGALQHSDIVEIQDGEVVYELYTNANMFRSERMNIYAENEAYHLGEKGELLTSMEETLTVDDSVDISGAVVTSDYTVVNELDRVVVQGTINDEYKENEKIQVILCSDEEQRFYNVTMSNQAKTTLLQQVTKKGLHGDYRVYVRIGDVVYDLEKNIQFQ